VLRSDATRQPALTEFRGGTQNTIGGGLTGTSFVPSMEQVQPPPLPAGAQVEPPADAVTTPDAAPAVPVPQMPPPPAQGE
jgi:general secretion pathway protein D